MFMQLHNGVQLDWIYWANKRKALNCMLCKRNNYSIKAPLTQFANIIRGFDSYWKSKFTVIIQDLTMSWGQHLHRILRRTDYKDDCAQVLLVVDCWSSLAKLSQHFVRFNFSHGIAFAHFPYFAQSVQLYYIVVLCLLNSSRIRFCFRERACMAFIIISACRKLNVVVITEKVIM